MIVLTKLRVYHTETKVTKTEFYCQPNKATIVLAKYLKYLVTEKEGRSKSIRCKRGYYIMEIVIISTSKSLHKITLKHRRVMKKLHKRKTLTLSC